MADSVQLDEEELAFLKESGLDPEAAGGALADGQTRADEGEQDAGEEKPARQEAAAEDQADDDGDGADVGDEDRGDHRSRTVNHGAFHQEREERKRLQAENRVLMERMTALLERATPKQEAPAQPKPPDVNEDPFGYMQHVGSRLEQIERASQQQNAVQQQSAVEQQIVSAYADHARQFAAQKPDFGQAYAHASQAFVNAAKMMGSQAPDRDAKQFEMNIVRTALQNGQNPAEAVYRFASQFGYRPEAAQPGQGQPDAAEAVDKLDTAARRHRSLSTAGGNAAPKAIGAKDILKMSPEEFHAFAAANYDAIDRELIGEMY